MTESYLGGCSICRAADRRLYSCALCARATCEQCLLPDAEEGARVCAACARLRYAKRRALPRQRAHWLRTVFSGLIAAAGGFGMGKGFFWPGAAAAVVGLLSLGWHLFYFNPCPRCGGPGRIVRRRGRLSAFKEFHCTLCGHSWVP